MEGYLKAVKLFRSSSDQEEDPQYSEVGLHVHILGVLDRTCYFVYRVCVCYIAHVYIGAYICACINVRNPSFGNVSICYNVVSSCHSGDRDKPWFHRAPCEWTQTFTGPSTCNLHEGGLHELPQ